VKLQPRVLEPSFPGAGRDLPLWALLLPDPAVAREVQLQLTYALWKGRNPTAKVSLIVLTTGRGALPAVGEASMDGLHRAVSLALPGFVASSQVPDRSPPFSIDLEPPAIDAAAQIGTSDGTTTTLPGPRLLGPAAAAPLLLPAPAPLRLDLDTTLQALGRLGVALELTLTLRRAPLTAEALRALATARQHLFVQLLRTQPLSLAPVHALRVLARLDALASAPWTDRIKVRLAVFDRSDTALAPLAAALLFGSSAAGPSSRGAV